MPAPIRNLSPKILACLWWFVAAGITDVFFRKPHPDIASLARALFVPYAFLAVAWFLYRRTSDLLEKSFAGQQATLALLRNRLGLLAMFAFFGIGMALFAGIEIQRSVIH